MIKHIELHGLNEKCHFVLTRQHSQQKDVVREGDESVTAEFVEDAVLLQFQIEPL